MKKIDKLIIGSFLGPFFLTFFVVIFILLAQFMLKYLDEIVGKDLDTSVIIQLIFYFSIFMTPNAFPLAILLSSLMTFGNLGEHFEITALKSAGISLVRVMVPIFVFAIFLTGAAYYSNNYIVPKANLKAFSLLYDVKQMKPSMDLKEGTFYNGIEGYSIKVGEKLPDGKSLKNLIIYDHTKGQGNKNIILADSGLMYNILNNRYLVLELFNGNTYSWEKSSRKSYLAQQQPDPLVRNKFDSQKIVFSLSSFDLKRTKEELFSSNRLMKNAQQLKVDVDSMQIEYADKTEEVKEYSFKFFDYHLQDIVSYYKERANKRDLKERALELKREGLEDEIVNIDNAKKEIDVELKKRNSKIISNRNTDSLASNKIVEDSVNKKASFVGIKKDQVKSENSGFNKDYVSKYIYGEKTSLFGKYDLRKIETVDVVNLYRVDSIAKKPTFEENMVKIDSLLNTEKSIKKAFNKSLTHVRYVKNNMMNRNVQLDKLRTELNKFQLERYKKFSLAATILIMFFIGAPLGAIIKRGGLGLPVLISLSFFILFYVISMMCEKWTRTDVMGPFIAAWMANFILLPVGMFFMKQAKNDARLFETDFYNIVLLKIKTYFNSLQSIFNKNK